MHPGHLALSTRKSSSCFGHLLSVLSFPLDALKRTSCCSAIAKPTLCVNMSAGLLARVTLRTWISWNRTTSWDHNCFTDKCLTLPVPCLSIIPSHALASVHNVMVGLTCMVSETDQLAEALHCGIQLCFSTRQRDVGLHFGPMHQDCAPVGDESATGRSLSMYISSPVTVCPSHQITLVFRDSPGYKSSHDRVA